MTQIILLAINTSYPKRALGRCSQGVRDVDAALLRIASGDFGLCDDCRTAIAVERLQAYPTAKRCHRCQVNHEHCYAGDTPSSM